MCVYSVARVISLFCLDVTFFLFSFVHVYQFVPFVFLSLFDLFVPFSLSLFTFFFIYLLIYVFCFSFTFHNHLFDVYSSSLALVSLCFFLSSAVHTCGLKQPLLFLFSKPKFPPFLSFFFPCSLVCSPVGTRVEVSVAICRSPNKISGFGGKPICVRRNLIVWSRASPEFSCLFWIHARPSF